MGQLFVPELLLHKIDALAQFCVCVHMSVCLCVHTCVHMFMPAHMCKYVCNACVNDCMGVHDYVYMCAYL